MFICRNSDFRKILKEVPPVELRGEAFLALFFFIVRVGSTKFEIPCDFWPVSSSSLMFEYRRKFDLANLKGSGMPPSQWLATIVTTAVTPTFGKYSEVTFFGYVGRKESRNTRKKKNRSTIAFG